MAQDIKEHLETENMEEETTEYQRNWKGNMEMMIPE
jgi:hypothetical protein